MNTDAQAANDSGRRRVLIIGVVVLAAAFAGGAVWAIPRIQNDLAIKVSEQLSAAGIGGVTVEFSGQDGTLRCVTELDDPAGVKARAEGIEGVRVLSLDSSCTGAREPSGGDTTAPLATETESVTAVVAVSDDGTVELTGVVGNQAQLDLLVGATGQAFGDGKVTTELTIGTGSSTLDDSVVGGLSSLVSVLAGRLQSGQAGVADGRLYIKGFAVDEAAILALTAAALDAGAVEGDIDLTVDLTAVASDLRVTAVFDEGKMTISGTVATDAQRQVLLGSAGQVLNPANVTSQVVVAAGIDVDEITLGNVASLIVAMPPNLLRGELDFNGSVLSVVGTYVTEVTRAAFEAVAGQFNVFPELEPRPIASAADAAALQKQLNEFVAVNPILFESDKAILSASANAILDQVAAIAKQFSGTSIDVQGHTDSTGDPGRNLKLSQARAEAVVAALGARGVPLDQLHAIGYGVTKPKVPNNSNENRAINRRVDFAVTTK